MENEKRKMGGEYWKSKKIKNQKSKIEHWKKQKIKIEKETWKMETKKRRKRKSLQKKGKIGTGKSEKELVKR